MTTVFVSACVLGAVFWFLALAEGVGMAAFALWVFRLGPHLPVGRVAASPRVGILPVGHAFETSSAKFKVIAPGVCLGRFKFRLSLFNTPFPVKAVFTADKRLPQNEWRIPVAPIGFFASCLLAWSSGFLATFQWNGGGGPGIAFLGEGWVGVAVITAFSVCIERRRAHTICSELESYCLARAERQRSDRGRW